MTCSFSVWIGRVAPHLALLLLILLSSPGCETGCPDGFERNGGLCTPMRADGGPQAGGNPALTGGGQAVSNGGAGVSVGGAGSMKGTVGVTGSAGNPSGSGTTTGSGSSGSGSTGTGVMASGIQGTGGANSTVGPATSSSSSDPCVGNPGGNVCDGAVLHKCSAMGTSMGGDACMSAALCQVGLTAGMCAICNPGTFHCEGTILNICAPEGQYMMKEPCASAELCNEDAGACTMMKCVPNTMSCAPDGSALRTCNADGSDFANQQPCTGKGCNAMTMTCNTCMPGEKMCAGDSVATCNADGQTMAMTPCMPTGGECGTATCSAAACVQGKKTLGTACSMGKCDALGLCVECITTADCSEDPGPCATKTCTLGTCGSLPKSKGTTCPGTNSMCDGAGKCVEKPCGNKKVDFDMGEQCDVSAPGWELSNGACDSNCKLTSRVYQLCDGGGGDCWTNSKTAGWFCSAVGLCSRICSTAADCQAAGTSPTCSSVLGSSSVCTIPCSGTVKGTCSTGNCQWYGTRGDIAGAKRMCGWISSDPSMNNMPWCPGEIMNCCSPSGGCIAAPPPPMP